MYDKNRMRASAPTANAEHDANVLKNIFFGIMLKVCCNEEDTVLMRQPYTAQMWF